MKSSPVRTRAAVSAALVDQASPITRGNSCELRFGAGDLVVENGVLVDDCRQGLDYASVPLSVISSGAISIWEDGKAVKSLAAGDVFGVFETACFLELGTGRRIGSWSLVANDTVRVQALRDTYWKSAPEWLKDAVVHEARVSHVPKPLSRLPLLDHFAACHAPAPVSDTALLFHCHLLESNYDLIKHLASLFGYSNCFGLEKPYSTIPHVFQKVVQTGVHIDFIQIDELMPYDYSITRYVESIWARVVRHVRDRGMGRIVVVSDGGELLESVPWSKLADVDVVAVEGSPRGAGRIGTLGDQVPPTVSIGNCKAKETYEIPFLADAVVRKLEARGLLGTGQVFGVLGRGAMAHELVRCLRDSEESLFVYDSNGSTGHETFSEAHSLEQLIQNSDVILGTTGTDILRGLYVERLTGHKTFVSASSSNVEFAYLFDLMRRYANRFEDVTGHITDEFSVTITNGGYPLNLDREGECESPSDIQLTRTLLYAGVLQALSLNSKERGYIVPLATTTESEVVDLWKEFKRAE